MPPLRFLHTSDLHLGRRFASLPQEEDGNIRGRLMEARHGAIARLAAAARAGGAAHILIAGDLFDTPTPSAGVVRQALAAMGEAADVRWWLLPGNHDNLLQGEPLWQGILRDAPPNVHALTDPRCVALAPGAALLPAPVTARDMGRDPTEALASMDSPEGALRIGLAHGGVVDFTESGAHVPPDRDRTARLDYLALGDWHGRMAVGERVQYSGSPEQDRFRHGRRGVCLGVEIAGPGAVPQIDEIETGVFLWSAPDLDLLPGQDAVQALNALLPADGRRDILLRVQARGRARLPDRAALLRAATLAAPEFAHFELRLDGLATEYDVADLDEIDQAGALRLAAAGLLDAARDPESAAEVRAVAGAALNRLYAYVTEAAE